MIEITVIIRMHNTPELHEIGMTSALIYYSLLGMDVVPPVYDFSHNEPKFQG